MIVNKCPNCTKQHVQTQIQNEWKSDGVETWAILRCQNPDCQRFILFRAPHDKQSGPGPSTDDCLGVFPAVSFALDPDIAIAEEVRADYVEAGTCLNAGCYKASMVMSRRALQRILKERGCEQNRLVDAIDDAVSKGVLRAAFKDLATEVRHYGNLGAHPDDDQLKNCTKKKAETVLEFLTLLIHDFYELPAKIRSLVDDRTD